MDRRQPHEIERAVATVSTALVGLLPLVCATILCGRRLAGGLSGQERPLALVLATLGGFLLVLANDAVVRLQVPGQGPWRWQPVMARMAMACGVAALVPPLPWQTAWWPAVAAAGTGLVGATLVGPGWRRSAAGPLPAAPSAQRPTAHRPAADRPGHAKGERFPQPTRPEAAVVATGATGPGGTARLVEPVGDGAAAVPAATEAGRLSPLGDLPAGVDVSHWLARFRRRGDGADCIQGRVVIVLPIGERTAHGHVAFCPPFVAVPDVDLLAQAEAAEVEVTAVEILPWGTRIECRLEQAADEPVVVVVSFTAAVAPTS
jgi:hypothetical protein